MSWCQNTECKKKKDIKIFGPELTRKNKLINKKMFLTHTHTHTARSSVSCDFKLQCKSMCWRCETDECCLFLRRLTSFWLTALLTALIVTAVEASSGWTVAINKEEFRKTKLSFVLIISFKCTYTFFCHCNIGFIWSTSKAGAYKIPHNNTLISQ